MSIKRTAHRGFTIVELLTVIAVMSILFAVAYFSYSAVQTRARESRIASDLSVLRDAIELGRVKTGTTLMGITGSAWTSQHCLFEDDDSSIPIPDGTNFSVQNSTTQDCWDDYQAALQAISTASGNNVTNLKDPWGRPYYIDENDADDGECQNDNLGWLSYPYVGGENQNTPADFEIKPRDPSC